MLTKISIRNFKRFDDVEFELGDSVVLIGPNNSGKTTALQALALWDAGLRQWVSKRAGKNRPEKRPGVTINRRDLVSIPVPVANLLWRNLHVRKVDRKGGKQRTNNIRVDIVVEGVTSGKEWKCGLEFDFGNEESIYCKPLRLDDSKEPRRMEVPEKAVESKVAFLPPMSGLADKEFLKQTGEITFLLGQGQTAQVLRNLCYKIYIQSQDDWKRLSREIESLFGVILLPPLLIPERSEISMSYKEKVGGSETISLDLSSAGRGLQQTLLLLAHLYGNPGTVLLLDEPDAHLEVLRQRENYQLLTQTAGRLGSQIIAASHSEVVLNEAADRDIVIAFVGKPHRIDDRGFQVKKSLKDIGFDQYFLAEEKGWVLYLEGSTDLAILQAFAETLGHPAKGILERPFIHYVGTNIPQKAREHFFGLREAKRDLVGIAIFDRLDTVLQKHKGLQESAWRKREIENYLCMEEVLLSYARDKESEDILSWGESPAREKAMLESIREMTEALRSLGKHGPWTSEIKATDEFLDPLFRKYFKKLKTKNLMQKTDYHVLARLVPPERIEKEVVKKLDQILKVSKMAKPRKD